MPEPRDLMEMLEIQQSDIATNPNFHLKIKGHADFNDVHASTDMNGLFKLMQDTYANMAKPFDMHQAMGQALREPIRLLARYNAWTEPFFTDFPVEDGADNRIALWNPLGYAVKSSPDGRAQYITPGTLLYTRPTFTEIDASVSVKWRTLAQAEWPVLRWLLEEAADDMARKIDNLAVTVMDAAIATVANHAVTETGATLLKSDIDTVYKLAAQTGFPITQLAINPGRLADMSGWVNVGTQQYPYFRAPEEKNSEMFQRLWAEGYLGLRYVISHNVPYTKVYLSGDPANTGYHQHHGTIRAVSDIDVSDKSDLHSMWGDHSFYVGNAVNLYSINITG